jgi:NAD(P)-dependent dehydrogenase (short-subunit alcohol dehydrogenase family)
MPITYDLAGKVALVTGAARLRGIGLTSALRLAKEGVHIALTDVCKPLEHFPEYPVGSWDELETAAEMVRELGVEVLPIALDVTDEEQVLAAFMKVHETFEKIDILVNNTGGAPGTTALLDMQGIAWKSTMDICATGTFLCTKAAAKSMIDTKTRGRIINIASTNGKEGWPGLSAYNAAKAAVILFTQTAAIELGPHQITVNAVCPGNIDTQMVRVPLERAEAEGQIPSTENVFKAMAEEVSLKRVGQPEDIANVVAFLASSDADFITGQAISVCGGLTVGAMVEKFETELFA